MLSGRVEGWWDVKGEGGEAGSDEEDWRRGDVVRGGAG